VLRFTPLEMELDPRRADLNFCKVFLVEHLDYDLYSDDFADDLAEILQRYLPEDQVNSAQTLGARVCTE